MRRYFYDLTQRFLAPLERYISSALLLPNQTHGAHLAASGNGSVHPSPELASSYGTTCPSHTTSPYKPERTQACSSTSAQASPTMAGTTQPKQSVDSLEDFHFDEKGFCQSLKKFGTSIHLHRTYMVFNQQQVIEQFYLDFIRGPHFRPWLAARLKAMIYSNHPAREKK